MSYQGSKSHIKNALKARVLALQSNAAKKTKRVSNYYSNPNTCKECETAITYEKKSQSQFCSRSCAGFFNTRNRNCSHSRKTKQAIKNGIERHLTNNAKEGFTALLGHNLVCWSCQNTFRHKRKKTATCSPRCLNQYRKKLMNDNKEAARQRGRDSMEIIMREGRWKGWSGQGEDKRSFPEKYIEELFVKDGIVNYIFQHQVSRYKIDFAFCNEMIAVEVDGKQHQYPHQAQSDQRKDELLTKAGWTVFRLAWYSVKTSSGQNKVMKQYNRLNKLLKKL